MTPKTFILLMTLSFVLYANAEEKYFTKTQISIFSGNRNIYDEKMMNIDQLDFLNYIYTQDEKADYKYFQVALHLRHANRYQINTAISLYNNLIPYAYDISLNYFLPKHFGIQAGSMSYRYYLTEFNGFYSSIIDKNITARYITRQWKFSMRAFYLGPTFQTRYNTIKLKAVLKTGLTTFTPIAQRNILKEDLTNFKTVYDYQSTVHFAPFIMPEFLINIDLLAYKKVIFGGRFKFSYLVTRNSINYLLNTYDWTYENPLQEKMKLPQHTFQQTDWDFGIYFKW